MNFFYNIDNKYMDAFLIKISCLANIVLISSHEKNKFKNESAMIDTNQLDSYYRETYELLMKLSKENFQEFSSLGVDRWIVILVNYFESKEEYERCSNLHKLGYDIFNTIY